MQRPSQRVKASKQMLRRDLSMPGSVHAEEESQQHTPFAKCLCSSASEGSLHKASPGITTGLGPSWCLSGEGYRDSDPHPAEVQLVYAIKPWLVSAIYNTTHLHNLKQLVCNLRHNSLCNLRHRWTLPRKAINPCARQTRNCIHLSLPHTLQMPPAFQQQAPQIPSFAHIQASV